jgi:hypothetical protein
MTPPLFKDTNFIQVRHDVSPSLQTRRPHVAGRAGRVHRTYPMCGIREVTAWTTRATQGETRFRVGVRAERSKFSQTTGLGLTPAEEPEEAVAIDRLSSLVPSWRQQPRNSPDAPEVGTIVRSARRHRWRDV